MPSFSSRLDIYTVAHLSTVESWSRSMSRGAYGVLRIADRITGFSTFVEAQSKEPDTEETN